MHKYFAIIVRFISNEKLYNAMLRLQMIYRSSQSQKHRNQQFEEIVSNFEITVLTHDFSALLDES